jgi:hypothetical protein
MPKAYMADVTVSCAPPPHGCGEPFRFTGLPAGMSFSHPMVSPNETELRAPIRPASSDPDFGMSLPGFAIGVRPVCAHGDGPIYDDGGRWRHTESKLSACSNGRTNAQPGR